MKNTIMSLLGLALVVGVGIGIFVYVKDREIKRELSGVEQSEFVDSNNGGSNETVASEINLTRVNGSWTVTDNGDYTIDPATLKFEFIGYKPGMQHVGSFQNMTADIAFNAAGDVIGGILKIDPTSVKTDTEAVDKHLQANVFFDTANYPQVTVTIKEIQRESDTSLKAITDITIKGITKTLSIPVTVEKTGENMKFAVDTRIKISEWNMAFGPVQDEVRVTASGELKRK
jgi:polyisoprenoid-binding protein YceI